MSIKLSGTFLADSVSIHLLPIIYIDSVVMKSIEFFNKIYFVFNFDDMYVM